MWFCKKKVKTFREFKKSKYQTEYNREKFEIGCTIIRLTFKDDSELYTNIYGEFNQYITHESDETDYTICREPIVSKPIITSSLHKAQEYLKQQFPNKKHTYVDDAKNPTTATLGFLVKATIVGTMNYTEEFQVAKIVPR